MTFDEKGLRMFDVFGNTTLWVFAFWLLVLAAWLLIHWSRFTRRLFEFGTSDADLPARTADMSDKLDDERRRIRCER